MSAVRAVIVLQARWASTRLPGKALELIEGRTLLARCLSRLSRSTRATVVLATTLNREDDALVCEAKRLGIQALRGAVDDVLGRFVQVMDTFHPAYVVRATGDNPAVDMGAADRALEALMKTGADYVLERDLPVGGAVEAMTADALYRADDWAVDPADREHVTTYIKRHPCEFAILRPEAPSELRRPDLRVTVDTKDDLRVVRDLFARAGGGAVEASLASLIAAADEANARARVA